MEWLAFFRAPTMCQPFSPPLKSMLGCFGPKVTLVVRRMTHLSEKLSSGQQACRPFACLELVGQREDLDLHTFPCCVSFIGYVVPRSLLLGSLGRDVQDLVRCLCARLTLTLLKPPARCLLADPVLSVHLAPGGTRRNPGRMCCPSQYTPSSAYGGLCKAHGV